MVGEQTFAQLRTGLRALLAVSAAGHTEGGGHRRRYTGPQKAAQGATEGGARGHRRRWQQKAVHGATAQLTSLCLTCQRCQTLAAATRLSRSQLRHLVSVGRGRGQWAVWGEEQGEEGTGRGGGVGGGHHFLSVCANEELAHSPTPHNYYVHVSVHVNKVFTLTLVW